MFLLKDNLSYVGLLGHPVQHSLSPLLHSYLMDLFYKEGKYHLFDQKEEDLPSFFQEIKKNSSFKGCNVTIPYKEKVFSFLDHIEAKAQRIGAVNTIYRKDDAWYGTNTDYLGFYYSLIYSPFFDKRNCKTAVLLGAGGAARSVACVFQDLGFDTVYVFNRSSEKGAHFCKEFNKTTFKTEFISKTFESRNDFLKHNKTDLLVNATSLGLKNKGAITIDFSSIKNKKMVCMDLVYNPLYTFFLKEAQKYHFPIINGLDMLIYQSLPAFALWFDVNIELENISIKEIRTLLCEHL